MALQGLFWGANAQGLFPGVRDALKPRLRVETRLLGVRVSVSVFLWFHRCCKIGSSFGFSFAYAQLQFLGFNFGLSFIQESFFILNTNYLNALFLGIFVLLR